MRPVRIEDLGASLKFRYKSWSWSNMKIKLFSDFESSGNSDLTSEAFSGLPLAASSRNASARYISHCCSRGILLKDQN